MKKTKNLLLLAVLTLILAACGGQDMPLVVQTPSVDAEAVIAEGHLVPRDDLTLAFAATGKIAEILVEKGDEVRSGQLLMQLGDRGGAEAGVASAQLELVSAQQVYDELVRTEDLGRADAWQAFMDAQVARADAERDWENLNVDTIEDRIEDRQADVNDRKEDLDDAQVEFDKYKDLEKDNSKRRTAKDELERAQENYNEAVRDLEQETRERDIDRAALDQALANEAEARHQYELSAKGPNTEQFALFEARLNDAKAQLAAAEDALANYDLKAPFDGLIMDVDVSINEMVGPEKAAVVVADTSQWYVETSDLTELEVVKVAEGQAVTFTADALTDSTMRGVVEQISQTYTLQGGDVLYTVRIRVEDVDPRLRWGMTVEVTFASLE